MYHLLVASWQLNRGLADPSSSSTKIHLLLRPAHPPVRWGVVWWKDSLVLQQYTERLRQYRKLFHRVICTPSIMPHLAIILHVFSSPRCHGFALLAGTVTPVVTQDVASPLSSKSLRSSWVMVLLHPAIVVPVIVVAFIAVSLLVLMVSVAPILGLDASVRPANDIKLVEHYEDIVRRYRKVLRVS